MVASEPKPVAVADEEHSVGSHGLMMNTESDEISTLASSLNAFNLSTSDLKTRTGLKQKDVVDHQTVSELLIIDQFSLSKF